MVLAFVLLSALAAAPAAQAQSYKVLYNFTGGSDGGPPVGSLVQDKAGNLYGTTFLGGDSNYGCADGCGTVFKVTKSGTETVLYRFTGGTDGGFPEAGLILSGNTLYGTTYCGGSGGGSDCDTGNGVVFEVNIKSGAETVLYTFTGAADGANPQAGLVRDKRGNLYGTTEYGGSSNYGTVFEVVPKSKEETVLHSFDGGDGANPLSGLTLNTTGRALFGTAYGGGSSGYGVVFSLTIRTGAYTVLHNFTGASDGGNPVGTLALDPKGNLYGTTAYGGDPNCGDGDGCGTVFEVVPKSKTETVLYSFTGDPDGDGPVGGVIRDTKGRLYGTTVAGGAYGYCGTVFELVKGTETVLHSFDWSDGGYPDGVVQDSKGNLYGTAREGGSDGWGVVWELTP
jgi:uncharacterized repeat protein (TIGR03803 family)